MRRARSLPAALLVALLVAGCGGGAPGISTVRTETPGPPPSPDPSCPFGGVARELTGTAQAEVSYRDAFGEAYARTFERTDAGIELGAPVSGGGLAEANAVHLSFGTREQATPGAIIGNSAVPFVDPDDGVEVLFRFWTLQASCDRLTGSLTNSYSNAGIGFVNGLIAPKFLGPGLGYTDWPFAMADGATLEAAAAGGRISMVIRGRDVEGILEFTITVDAA